MCNKQEAREIMESGLKMATTIEGLKQEAARMSQEISRLSAENMLYSKHQDELLDVLASRMCPKDVTCCVDRTVTEEDGRCDRWLYRKCWRTWLEMD